MSMLLFTFASKCYRSKFVMNMEMISYGVCLIPVSKSRSSLRMGVGTAFHGPLPLKTIAPDFTLKLIASWMLSLGELQKARAILASYPHDRFPGHGDRRIIDNEVRLKFHRVKGVRFDSSWSGRGIRSGVSGTPTLFGSGRRYMSSRGPKSLTAAIDAEVHQP